MTPWMLALLALIPAVAIPVGMALHGATAHRLVAVQLAQALATLVLLLMTFVFDQSSFVDLGLTLALMSLPGTLMMAIFLERWL